MKKLITCLFVLISSVALSQNWVWLKGSYLVYQESNYGTQGILSPTNSLGARQNAGSWYLNGNYFLFGGLGISSATEGHFNDLWKYDSASKNWVWLKGSTTLYQLGRYGTKGVANINNAPGARVQPVTWVLNNELYLYGGTGVVPDGQGGLMGVFYGDLWKYSLQTNMWTWLHGDSTFNTLPVFGTIGVADPSNTPGGLQDCIGWTRNGKLYLFGGSGIQLVPENTNNAPYNNVWEYDPVSNTWTWINGSGGVIPQLPFFDSNNINSAANNPGGKFSTQGTCTGNEFYLFGGGLILSSSPDFIAPVINDLWKFKHSTNTWERIQTGQYDDAGNYGTIGVPNTQNRPPARVAGAMFNFGNKLYLYSGSYPPYGDHQFLNDLWTYDLNTNLWTWIKGSNLPAQPFGSRGPLGIYQPSNNPGGRATFNGAATNTGIYIFGGYGYFDPNEQTSPFTLGNEGTFGDLWKFDVTNTSSEIACGNNKVLVCHIPPGNPANAHTICVSQNAVAAHLAHGDYLGPCTTSNRGVVSDYSDTDEDEVVTSLTLNVLPNPASSYFTVRIISPSATEKIKLSVFDMNGKLVETFDNLPTNKIIKLGEQYRPGVYLVQVVQGKEKKSIKIVKL